jgi:hypothetical protein
MTKLNFPAPDLDDLPEEFAHLAEMLDTLTDEVATRVAKEVDTEITKAIQMRIGMHWKPRDLFGRLHRTIYMDGSEVLTLDGVPLLHIGPFKMLPMGPSTMLTPSRECTHLKGADDTLPN